MANRPGYQVDFDTVKQIVEMPGFDIKFRDEQGYDALFLVLNESDVQPEMVKYLIGKGCDVNYYNKESGENALSCLLKENRESK